MNTFIKSALAFALLQSSISQSHATVDKSVSLSETDAVTNMSVIDNSVSLKRSPEVTLDIVQDIFGHNLETNDNTLRTLLLAIGMDHTTNESPNFKKAIGIPYIVDRGPVYWVNRLTQGNQDTEVLVNNALLLLFAKHEIPNSKIVALHLMRAAANNGYWPASYYLAEFNLTTHLSGDHIKESTTANEKQSDTFQIIAKTTMKRYNECAKIGFAPCQYRVGFWLIGTDETLKDGLDVLRLAINTTLKDTRYSGVLDDSIILAAREIVFKGEAAGLDYVVRREYTTLIEQQLSTRSAEVERLKESQKN